MSLPSLYKECLQKISFFLKEETWKAGRENNPFKHLPPKIIRDLMTSILLLQHQDGFKPEHLELLLTSGMLPELKLEGMDVRRNLGRTLVSLASACQNLEVLTLRDLKHSEAPGISEALENVLSNSLKLEVLNCEIHFDLRALRKCTNLRSVTLNFLLKQPWCDFLKVENGCFQNLNSLELFAISNINHFISVRQKFADYILVILKHCPAISSLGSLDTTRPLAQLYRSGTLPLVKLRHCHWRDHDITELRFNKDLNKVSEEPLMKEIRDVIIHHSFVEELDISLFYPQSIPYLSNLKNLVFLDIKMEGKSDVSVIFGNVLEEIGIQLKHLKFSFPHPVDVSSLLKKCPNLESLGIISFKYPEHFETSINLPNLKYLTLVLDRGAPRLLSLFTNCHNLSELFMLDNVGFDDETLNSFLTRNSLSKLKIAYFEHCSLTTSGFHDFFLNAPELRNIVIQNCYERRHMKKALLRVNHNVNCDKRLISIGDEFFRKKSGRYF